MSDASEYQISMAGGDGDDLECPGAGLAPGMNFPCCLEDDLATADAAYTAAVQAAVAGHGDWASVQVAGHAVRQARSAARAS